jgi:hypothetical protein
MSVNVSMQSPIPDYGNFGQVVSQNWQRQADRKSENYNAAQERGLRLKIHEDNFGQRKAEFDETMAYNKGVAIGKLDGIDTLQGRQLFMQEETHKMNMAENDYRIKERSEMNKIDKAKFDFKRSKDLLDTRYQDHLKHRSDNMGLFDYTDIFGIQSTSYWDEPTYDEWLEESGQFLTDEAKTVKAGDPALSYNPSMMTSGIAQNVYTQKPWEKTAGPATSDEQLYENMSNDGLIQLVPMQMQPYTAGGQ